MSNTLFYEEKQFLGFNSYSISRRMVLAIFCFVTFYYSESRMENADILFLLGILLLVLSVILLFIKYLYIYVDETTLNIQGMWKKQLVRIPLTDIVRMEKSVYNRYHMNNPVFNVHVDKEIRFYTTGRDAVRIELKNGHLLNIGTARAEELIRVIKQQIEG
jgi:hypothetical protein